MSTAITLGKAGRLVVPKRGDIVRALKADRDARKEHILSKSGPQSE